MCVQGVWKDEAAAGAAAAAAAAAAEKGGARARGVVVEREVRAVTTGEGVRGEQRAARDEKGWRERRSVCAERGGSAFRSWLRGAPEKWSSAQTKDALPRRLVLLSL